MNATDIGLIVIPLVIALCGAVYGGIRGAVRFAQYLVRSEASQADIARTNQNISDQLTGYIKKSDERYENHDRRITVVETIVGVVKQ